MGSAFFRHGSPRPSGATDAPPVTAQQQGLDQSAGAGSNGSGRDSLPAPPVAFGFPPQLGMPLGPGVSRPSLPSSSGRPSVPGGEPPLPALGRPSAPLISNREQVTPFATGRPSAPPRLQG